MPAIKTKPPEPHEHLDGDFGLDGLAELKAHFKGTGHLKAPFPGDSWKVLTRKHMKAHGFTPVDGAPASAEALNEQISGLIEPLFPELKPGQEWHFSYEAPDEAKAVWNHLYDSAGSPPSAEEFEAGLSATAYAKGGMVPGGKHLWPELPPHECPPEPEPAWDIGVWVAHSDITNLEQAALAKAAAATKKAKWLKVQPGYHVTTLPEPGTLEAQNSAEKVSKAVEAGHTIAAHITVAWLPPAQPAPGFTPGAKPPGLDGWLTLGGDLYDACKALGIWKQGMTIKDMAAELKTWATAKSGSGGPHPNCAFADHKDYKVVKDELAKAAKILGIASPGALSLTKLAASVAVQVKAMDNQLDAVLGELGIKPPDGAPAAGVNAGKLIPSSLAPAPPEDGKGVASGQNWTKAYALLKFAGQLEHDEATDALGFAALNKNGWHKGGIHVTSPDPNSYTVWFGPEPDDEAPDPGYPAKKVSAVVIWKAKGKPKFMPDQGKYHYPPSQMLMGDIGTKPPMGHLDGGECFSGVHAGQALTTGPGFWTHEQAVGILEKAQKHAGHALHVPAGNPQVTVVWSPGTGKYCMKWHQAGDPNPAWQPAGPGLKEHQAIDALVKSGWYDANQALIVVLQAKGNAEHEVKAPFAKVTFSTVTGLYTVEITGAPKQAKSALTPSPQEQQAMDAAEAELKKETPVPPPLVSFDELLEDAPAPHPEPVSWNSKLTWSQAMFALKNDSEGQLPHATASILLAEAKGQPGKPVVTPKVQVMRCVSGSPHYHVGWPGKTTGTYGGKAGPVKLAKPKTGLHGGNTHNYSEALIKLKDLFGMSDAGASELLKNAQDEPGELLTWKGPKGIAKVKWHLPAGHFHIWAGSW